MTRRTALLFAASRFRDTLWRAAAPIQVQIDQHPFLAGLTAGTLPADRFRFYIEQDALYLTAFAEALHILATKAPHATWAQTLKKHATESIDAERALHNSLLKAGPPKTMAPTNYAYSNHLLAVSLRKPFAEALSAMLPCYWIYWEVGKNLRKQGSPNAQYRKWIDQYSDPSYGATVETVLQMMDQSASTANQPACIEQFTTSARYEYQFWDMAWRKEEWKP
jgi:thiaminase/transcriptional activator TenA